MPISQQAILDWITAFAGAIAAKQDHLTALDAAIGDADAPDRPLGTDAAQIHRAIEEVWSADGVLVLMDLGSALLSAQVALDMLDPVQRGRVRLCAAPVVEGAI